MASLAENYLQFFALLNSNQIEEIVFNEYDKIHYSVENKIINFNKSQIKQLKNKTDWLNDYIVKEDEELYGEG